MSGSVGSGAIGSLAIGVGGIGSTGSTSGGGGSTPIAPPTFKYVAPPPTRLLSWTQMCLEADPDFRRLSQRPWIYEFSNGRLFVESLPVYGSTGITDDFGTPITDDYGTQIQSDTGGATPSGGAQSQTGFPFGSGAFGQTGF